MAKKILLIFLIIPYLVFSQWTQDGDFSGYGGLRLGSVMAMSKDGNVIAVGNDFNNDDKVRIYVKLGASWIERDVISTPDDNHVSNTISLSSDGNTLAIGTPSHNNTTGLVRVYTYNNGSWTQKGGNILGEFPGNNFGRLSLSGDGNRIAIASPGTTSSANYVKIFYFNDNTSVWNEVRRIGGSSGTFFGESIALSEDGTTVVIGSPLGDSVNGSNSGSLIIYRETTPWVWTKVGNTIFGAGQDDRLGSSVEISATGRIIAGASSGINQNGYVDIYENTSGSIWTQLGSSIPGGTAFLSNNNTSIGLSNDGTVIAVGKRFDNNSANIRTGSANVYKYSSNTWLQVDNTIYGTAVEDGFGYAVELSGNGGLLAVGSPFYNSNNRGRVDLFFNTNAIGCLAPNNINITVNSSTQTTVSWDSATHAISYDVTYAISGQPISSGTTISGITNTTVTLNGLVEDQSYDVYVRTNCNATPSSSKSDYSLPVTFLQSNRIFVDRNASGSNNGTSWVNAYTDIQTAINNKPSYVSSIWIAKGTYKPHVSDRNISFELNKSKVKIYGGFAGNETSLSDRDISLIHITNETVLSGDLQDNDDSNISFNNATRADNSLRIVNITTEDVEIDGVTISGGYANASSGNGRFGAGLSVDQTSNNFVIKNCIIKNNVAFWAAGLNLAGQTASTKVKIEASIFENNLTSNGASAFYVVADQNQVVVDFTLVNSLFRNNKTMDDGARKAKGLSAGWVRSYTSGAQINSTIINNTFVNNVNEGTGTSDFATLGIGQQSGSYGQLNISNNIFWGNSDNNGNTALAIGKASDTSLANGIEIFNSIDENNFSNITNKTNTSNSDPLFTDAPNNDFTLQTTSPAKDTGDNTKIPSGVGTDLLGKLRIHNSTVDMGAYEFGSMFPVLRTLTINAANGSVSTNPNPINGTYDDGASIELTATPDAGYQFDGWSGDANGATNPLTIMMDADKTVTAMFSKIQRALTINATNGSVSTNPNPINGTYDDGASVELTARPASGYQFDGWSGDATGTTNPLIITMDADKTITATFSKIQRTLTINATNGSVSTNPNPTNGTYDDGTSVELTATPNAGYQFDGWSGDATGTANPLTITMDANKTVTATFSKIQRTLTINATNGSVSTNPNSTNGTYDDGTLVELTAIPDAGYQFDGWSGDASGTTNPLTITMDADKSVRPIFKLIPPQVTLTLNATNGTVTTNPNPVNGTYDKGTIVELTATPDGGYEFEHWIIPEAGTITTNPISIPVNSSITVTAVFNPVAASVVDEVFNNNVKIYPNPATDLVHIDLKTGFEVRSIVVYNVLGKKVREGKETTVNLSGLVNGVYLFKITDIEGRVASRKIIKK